VLVDLVLNHVHEDAPLWQNHQADWPAWFHLPAESCQATDWTKPITCWFAGYLPDFEYKNPAAMDAIMEHAAWLVRETNIDGFRVDAVKHMIDDAVLHLRGRLARDFARTGIRFYMVGETFTGEDGSDLLAHYVGPTMLDGQFDFPLYWQLTAVFLREERDLSSLASMVEWNDTRYGHFAVMSNFLGNHDVCRALSQANGDIADIWCNGGKAQGWDNPPGQPDDETAYRKLRLAWTFLLTSPGVPLIYYGDEFGLAGAGDPDNRRPMLFGSESLDPHQLASLRHVQTLGQARARHPAMRRGQRWSLLTSADGLAWAYGLSSGSDRVVVVLNRAVDHRQLQVPVDALGLDEGTELVEVLTDGALVVTNGSLTVDLDGRSAAVLVME
jgi:glycosidase